jgi:hypothetical protein
MNGIESETDMKSNDTAALSHIIGGLSKTIQTIENRPQRKP